VLAYFATNGGTETVNLLIEKTRRLAHGFRNFTNYRLRILLVADATPLSATAEPSLETKSHLLPDARPII
jgi:hypothetical protein